MVSSCTVWSVGWASGTTLDRLVWEIRVMVTFSPSVTLVFSAGLTLSSLPREILLAFSRSRTVLTSVYELLGRF
jgi:hypothetical protein